MKSKSIKPIEEDNEQKIMKYTVCKKLGFVTDGFNSITDITLTISIFINKSLAYDANTWFIFNCIAGGCTVFGLLLYFIKFIILNTFYRYILVWRMKIKLEQNQIVGLNEQQKISKWKGIESKHKKIQKFLGYLVIYDLFGAALQDSLQAMVVLYIFTDLKKADNDIIDSEYNELLLDKEWNEWQYFEWILRCKLMLCIIFMIYKLFNALVVECECHSDKIKNKRKIKPKYIESDSELDDDEDIEPVTNQTKYNHDGYIPMNDKEIVIKNKNNYSERDQVEMQLLTTNPLQNEFENDENEELKQMALNEDDLEKEILPKELLQNDDNVYYKNEITKTTQCKKSENEMVVIEEQINKQENVEQDVEENEDGKEDEDENEDEHKNEDEFVGLFKNMNETKKELGDLVGREYENKWKGNIVELVYENKDDLRNDTMKPVMLNFVDSIFDNLEHGNGANRFIKALQILKIGDAHLKLLLTILDKHFEDCKNMLLHGSLMQP